MASTNKTNNLKLSQFTLDDDPSWYQDYNADMLKLDDFAGDTKGDLNTTKAALNAHVADKANPHSVTAGQIDSYTKDEIDFMLSNKADSGAVKLKLLWSGSLTSGNITVPGISTYTCFCINTAGLGRGMGFRISGTHIHAQVLAYDTSNNITQYLTSILLKTSGDVVTVDYAKYIAHTQGATHGNMLSVALTGIYGLEM